jgi:putative tryptophan/tyrosine transport system substrate-binding protein
MMISTRVLQFGSAVVRASLAAGLPLGAHSRRIATEGALFSYGPDLRETGRAGARHVDRILRGAKPADIPVEDRDVLELIVNLKTAETLGLPVPERVLRLQATDVLQ